MGDIGLLETVSLLLGQRELPGGQGVGDVTEPGGADDGRGHARTAEQPGQRDLGRGRPALGGDLDMPLDQVKAVLRAPDVETRTKEIIAHLTAMETKLAEMQMSVASLRALLEGPPVRPAAEFRSVPPAQALAAGAVFTFLAAGYLITSFQAPALTVRFGRRVIAIGAVIAAAGDAALYLATAHGGAVAWLFPGLVLLGAGQGLCITPLTTTVLSHAAPATAGSVSGALSTAQQVGNSGWPSPACFSSALSATGTARPSSTAFSRWVPCSSWWPRLPG